MNSEQLINEVLAHDNMKQAVKQVRANKGSVGIDGKTVEELENFMDSMEHRRISNLIKQENYRPKPVKMVEIPKPDGGVRMLGIPTSNKSGIDQNI